MMATCGSQIKIDQAPAHTSIKRRPESSDKIWDKGQLDDEDQQSETGIQLC
ncbi:hypothetical protein L915_16859 [Phytophthora nicotianae]|uniref:Uncharacterized protein n=1 Tax=Phytophthora nicotianae TaxID=4792 RepID=W2G173_PHYNI|nr:hypothetical protein L915_16859 [Phytophthora nicotianae]